LCKEAERDVGADIQGYLTEILDTLKVFYPEELDMLEYLAKDESQTFGEMASSYPEFVEHLIGYGIVIRRRDDFEFAFDAVAEAVRKNLRQLKALTAEGKWLEVSSRRNKLEEEIRTALYRWSTRLADEEWSKSWRACVTTKRQAEIGPLNRREAFSRNNSPLYFSELLKFVQYCNEFGTGEISTSDITAAMNCVNTHRIDAHAKAIDDPNYMELKASLEILENIFLPP
jgi:hypothetical protein